jgi:hypothetical protein
MTRPTRTTSRARSASPAARIASAALGFALSGCPTPAQEGGLERIDVSGLARRLELLCASGRADPSCPTEPASPASRVPDGASLAPVDAPDATPSDGGDESDTSAVHPDS